jgi:fused signal recognition particle receptor
MSEPDDNAPIVTAIPGLDRQKTGGWLQRLSQGLSKSSRQLSEQVTSVLTKKRLDADDLEALEDMLVEADLGAAAAARVAAAFGKARFGKEATETEVKESLADAIAAELKPFEAIFTPLAGPKPYVVLFVGVNGSGKTTTLGKIAADLRGQGAKVLIAAGDTFRAAAIEQLQVWAERSGAEFISRPPGADAAGLAFDAVARARESRLDVVLIDTAGRLQNKSGLMDELGKIVRVLKKIDPAMPHETLLVLDATVGRNALSQVEVFTQVAGVTGIVMTKLDGTARGGVLVPVAEASHAPIKLIGVGEAVEDLQAFDAAAFARSLVGLTPKP